MANPNLSQFLPLQPNQTRSQFLEIWEERWNKRIDEDVTILGEGLGRVVAEAQRALQPSLAATATSHLALQVQTQTLIQSADSLLALTHQLKLFVLLSDSETPKVAVEKEEKELAGQVERAKQEIGDALKNLAAAV
ncbi:hypothetical protein FFLO_06685 [Filobasidium floriforme]|uniref:Uncharacterized protein n=1 Tax=Filobasidium floriforme TaxID=5210 RepID=A0A8K0JED9_9TREE|nr:hypothetical protein FFLO_06685 [Filobasidium floriforme]